MVRGHLTRACTRPGDGRTTGLPSARVALLIGAPAVWINQISMLAAGLARVLVHLVGPPVTSSANDPEGKAGLPTCLGLDGAARASARG